MDQLTLPDVGTVRLTGPRPATVDARATIVRLHARGLGWTRIAQELNATGIPTPSGRGQWHATSAYRHTQGRDGWARYMRAYRSRG